MKKINNKGFTLIELLAVLVILITILTIAIPSITSSVERNKENMLNKKIDIIETTMELYVSNYKNNFDYDKFINNTCCINISKLVDKGLLTNDDITDADGNKLDGSICYVNKKYKYYDKLDSNIEDKGEC